MIAFPSASAVIASTTEFSAPLFLEFLSYIWFPLGIVVAVAVAVMIKRYLSRGVGKITGSGGKRGGRRRR